MPSQDAPEVHRSTFTPRDINEPYPKILPMLDKKLFVASTDDEADRVFMSAHVFDCIMREVKCFPEGSVGILFGSWCQTEQGDFIDIFTHVSLTARNPEIRVSGITEELLQQLYCEEKEKHEDCFILGFYATHPHGGMAVKDEIADVYKELFSLPWQVCFLADGAGRQCIHQWKDDASRPGHLYVYVQKTEAKHLVDMLDAHKTLRCAQENAADPAEPDDAHHQAKAREIARLQALLESRHAEMVQLEAKLRNGGDREKAAEKIGELSYALQESEEEVAGLRGELAKLQDETDKLHASHRSNTLELEIIRHEFGKLSDELDAKDHELQSVRNKASMLTRELEDFRVENAGLIAAETEEAEALRGRVMELEIILNERDEDAKTGQEALMQVQSSHKLEVDRLQSEIDKLNNVFLKEASDKIHHLEEQLAKRDRDAKQRLEGMEKIHQEEIERLNSQLGEKKKDQELMQIEIKRLSEQIREHAASQQDARMTEDGTNKKVTELEREVENLIQQIQDYEANKAFLSPESEAIREDMERKDKEIENLTGTIARLRNAKNPVARYKMYFPAIAASIFGFGIMVGTVMNMVIKDRPLGSTIQEQPIGIVLSDAGDHATTSVNTNDSSDMQDDDGAEEAAQWQNLQEEAGTDVQTTWLDPLPSRESSDTAGTDPEAPPTPESEVYIVKRGDSLWKIAYKMYGDGNKWKRIAATNNIKGPRISPGDRLIISSL